MQEDLMLVSAWLNISMDAIYGNDQTKQRYWERVHAYFHQYKDFESDRSPNSLMHRWSTIQLAVSKFQVYYSQIDGRNQSETTELDKISQAMEMYRSLQKSTFTFLHCWHELRHAPKFCSTSSKKKSKISQNESPATSSPSTPDSVNLLDIDVRSNEPSLERPIGDAAKECGRKDKSKVIEASDEEIKNMLTEMTEKRMQSKMILIEQANEMLRLKREKVELAREKIELERRKEEREQMIYEERIIGIDISEMDELQAEYYKSLKLEIIQKRRNTRFPDL
ncbi:glutathione S-transferase T3-like isoform X2 [Diospyros lotus]|nr:glutathione S-transferase T3-like isoform X2 [Diospyros lotus]